MSALANPGVYVPFNQKPATGPPRQSRAIDLRNMATLQHQIRLSITNNRWQNFLNRFRSRKPLHV